MRHMRPLSLLGMALWLVLWLVGVGSAAAHANLERASPASNAVLNESPREVQILFSEEPEPRFSEIALYDASGRRVETGPLRVLANQPRALAIDVPALPDSTYTVSWKTLSAVDGHTAAGAYTFAIGVGQVPGAPTLPATAEDTTARDWPSAAVRWLTYLSAAILVGAVPFISWIARPVATGAPGILATSRRLAMASAIVAVIVGVVGLTVQASRAASVGLVEALGSPQPLCCSERATA
jgi:methionine-rich copper-binding protein CopC